MFIIPDDDTLLDPTQTDQLLNAAFKQNKTQELVDAMDQAEQRMITRLKAPEALYSAACWYASNGIPIFPCKPRGKQPATRHGFKDATSNMTQIHAWWQENPTYNIGVPTGHLFDVIDVDHIEAYEPATLLLGNPDTVLLAQAVTPRGKHFYIKPTGERNKTSITPHLDYRGVGGYVIAPPSQVLQKNGESGLYWWLTPPIITPPQHAADTTTGK